LLSASWELLQLNHGEEKLLFKEMIFYIGISFTQQSPSRRVPSLRHILVTTNTHSRVWPYDSYLIQVM